MRARVRSASAAATSARSVIAVDRTRGTLRRPPKHRAGTVDRMLLDAPVPDPGPPGPFGTMPWLRATVSRFSNGEAHARRRALVVALLEDLDPAELREAARERKLDPATRDEPDVRAYIPVAVLAAALGVPEPRLADAV